MLNLIFKFKLVLLIVQQRYMSAVILVQVLQLLFTYFSMAYKPSYMYVLGLFKPRTKKCLNAIDKRFFSSYISYKNDKNVQTFLQELFKRNSFVFDIYGGFQFFSENNTIYFNMEQHLCDHFDFITFQIWLLILKFHINNFFR